MRKVFTLFAVTALALSSLRAGAQTLLDEGFERTQSETATETFPDGWSRVSTYAGSHQGYRWTLGHNSTSGSQMSGYFYAYCDAPTYESKTNPDGLGPRKETLVSPELTLDGSYVLQFDWKGAAAAVLRDKSYTFQVAVISAASPADTAVIFDIQNEQQVRDSGVPADIYGTYIWTNWAVNTSKLDLSAYQGQKVKIAFIYKMLKKTGNIFYLDNVSVFKDLTGNGPVAEGSQSSYRFGQMYVGEKHYSDAMTIKNVGKKGLKITGFDAPSCIGLVMDSAHVDLNLNESAAFNLSYTASLTSPVDADAVIHTNGGDVTIHVTADKEAVPDGYSLELFEGAQFPPAGWTNSGWGTYGTAGLEGDHSAYASGGLEDTYLTTPRLNLKDPAGPHKFMFTYYSSYTAESDYAPNNDLSVQLSTDGGKTFPTTVWTWDYNKTDTLINVTVNLDTVSSDNVKLRFKNLAVEYDSEQGAYEWATHFVDRVLLPNLYGQQEAPEAVELLAPADSATNVFNKQVKLSWREAQFATGYKVYVGKSATNFDVVNGVNVGDTTSYTLAQVDNATTYYWKVVPFNAYGEAKGGAVWQFTTQADATVRSFPWFEGFESEQFAPVGWLAQGKSSYTRWDRTGYYTYDGKGSALAFSNDNDGEATLTSPDIEVPASGSYLLSFWWGDNHPTELVRDDKAVHVNRTTRDDGIDALCLDVFSDGAWKQASLISNNVEADGKYYWCFETLDLAPYAGKTIALRWRYVSHDYNRNRSAALDNVKIAAKGANLAFNVNDVNFYKVNYGVNELSDTIAVSNLGNEPVTVSRVSFSTPHFTSTLQPGTVIDPAGSVLFRVIAHSTVATADSVALADSMAITLSDGSVAHLPIEAVALASDYVFYGFERDATGVVPSGFTGIDVDGVVTSALTFWTVPNVGHQPMSFFVLNDAQCYSSLKEPHGKQSLMTRCNSNLAFDDWIVSSQLTAAQGAKFQFDARNWESVNSIMPADAPTLKVWVSEKSATDRSTFTQVGDDVKLELFDNKAWTRLSYDLSAYAGKQVYVALEATSANCLGAFYDNFEFQHMTRGLQGDVNADGVVNTQDVSALVQAILTGDSSTVFDIDGNGAVNTLDVTALVNLILSHS